MASMSFCSVRLASGNGTLSSRPSAVARPTSLRKSLSGNVSVAKSSRKNVLRHLHVEDVHPAHHAAAHALPECFNVDTRFDAQG